MKLIGFDSATDDAVFAASWDGRVTFERRVGPGPDGRPSHSRALLEGITEAVDSLGGWGEVDRIAVGLGPGTFTGLRIAVATAAGLSMSTGTAAIGVSTLEAMARTLSDGGGLVAPVLDAKRGEVFAAVYDENGAEFLPPAAVEPAVAAESINRLDRPVRVGGPGAVRFAGLFADAGIRVEGSESDRGRLTGVTICELGAAIETPGPDQPLKPIYIREPDAQLWLERDSRSPLR